MYMVEGDRYEIGIGDPLYPASLMDLDEPPKLLYVIGNPCILSAKSVSITGTRNATSYGKEVAKLISGHAAKSYVPVVTGGAVGCEKVAMETAIEYGGQCIAVLGTGADVAYPSKNAELFARIIAEDGALVSISPWGQEPRRTGFVRRNKVIAALSKVMFVVEAGFPSGILSKTEIAIELGRRVFSCPGSIFAESSKGCNMLLQEGASAIVGDDTIAEAIWNL